MEKKTFWQGLLDFSQKKRIILINYPQIDWSMISTIKWSGSQEFLRYSYFAF
jgi:hypothetical protein